MASLFSFFLVGEIKLLFLFSNLRVNRWREVFFAICMKSAST